MGTACRSFSSQARIDPQRLGRLEKSASIGLFLCPGTIFVREQLMQVVPSFDTPQRGQKVIFLLLLVLWAYSLTVEQRSPKPLVEVRFLVGPLL